jgi:hypothetical protein
VCKQGVLVPKAPGPRHIADRHANVHPQQDAQKQLGALQPARNPPRGAPWLEARRGSGLNAGRGARCCPRHRAGSGLRRGSRARVKREQCQFRLLGHFGSTLAIPRVPPRRSFNPADHGQIARVRLESPAVFRAGKTVRQSFGPAVEKNLRLRDTILQR